MRTAPPRYWLVGLAVIFFIGFPTVISSFLASEWTQALVLAIAIMGLNILVGYSGQLSLGHGAFMALGAYTSAILARHYNVDYLLTIPIAGVLTGLVGFLFGIPAAPCARSATPRWPRRRRASTSRATRRWRSASRRSMPGSRVRCSAWASATSARTRSRSAFRFSSWSERSSAGWRRFPAPCWA